MERGRRREGKYCSCKNCNGQDEGKGSPVHCTGWVVFEKEEVSRERRVRGRLRVARWVLYFCPSLIVFSPLLRPRACINMTALGFASLSQTLLIPSKYGSTPLVISERTLHERQEREKRGTKKFQLQPPPFVRSKNSVWRGSFNPCSLQPIVILLDCTNPLRHSGRTKYNMYAFVIRV
jgi:hypothetical protein